MGRADEIRALAERMAGAGGKRIAVSIDSARLTAHALNAYADHISTPKVDFPNFTIDVWDN